jgi:hypothetical protein
VFRWIKATRDDGKIIVLDVSQAHEMELIPGSRYTTIKFANGETINVQEPIEEFRSRFGTSN